MKRLVYGLILLVGALVLYEIGARHGSVVDHKSSGKQKVLYYVDPMNPAHTSDKPGLAPCGMKMEPVYADSGGEGGTGAGGAPPGAIRVSSERQQAIGVRTEKVRVAEERRRVRTFGKVTEDETRAYVINTATEGWIQDVHRATTGSIVERDELLATFFSREFLAAEQSFFYALNTLERLHSATESLLDGGEGEELAGAASPEQLVLTNSQVQSAIETLETLGMGRTQIEELEKSRQYTQYVQIRSPAKAFVLKRNVSVGQRFSLGVELYRLANLDKVWVLADLFENEVQFVKPGSVVQVTLPHTGGTRWARVSDVLPQFDPASRSLKVRIEVDNPDYLLRPEMFVDVEFETDLPPAIVVPLDAVLDAGLKKIVFVDLGGGYVEARRVETGVRAGDKVQILGGLMEGESIVVSGNFLLDSESRMKQAASGLRGEVSRCPVCGMDVEASRAKAAGLAIESEGRTVYLCSEECRKAFEGSSRSRLGTGGNGTVESGSSGNATGAAHEATAIAREVCPVCGKEIELAPGEGGKLKVDLGGTVYHLCSPVCRMKFESNSQYFTGRENAAGSPGTKPAEPGKGRMGHD